MARYTTHKNTAEGKRVTITKRTTRRAKYRPAATFAPEDNNDAARAMRLLARELGAKVVA